MFLIYNFFLILSALILSPVIAAALIIQPKFRAGFFKKAGFYKFKHNGGKTAVFHAVSAGETNAVKELIKRYKNMYPDENIIVTTTTKTGQEIAKKAFENTAADVTYFPFDFFFSVNSFFNTYKPEKVIIAETEIWPGFLMEAEKRGIKVYIVNGRISPHSYSGYKKIKLFLAPVLNCYEKIFMQSKDDAERIIDIGAKACKTEVMGNLKFDTAPCAAPDEVQKYKEELKTDNLRVFIAASTHKGEDETAVQAYKALKEKHSDAAFIIAPRHPERFDDVFKLLEAQGLKAGKRSNKDNFNENDVILLDTMGELSKLFSVCHTAFIGGSFSGTGGHNPLEANIWGKPVISGSCVFNFKDVYKTAIEKKCAVIVNTPEELTAELISFYDNELKYKTFCSNAKKVFDENRGAVNYVLNRI